MGTDHRKTRRSCLWQPCDSASEWALTTEKPDAHVFGRCDCYSWNGTTGNQVSAENRFGIAVLKWEPDYLLHTYQVERMLVRICSYTQTTVAVISGKNTCMLKLVHHLFFFFLTAKRASKTKKLIQKLTQTL